jgi:hypothetical protein
VQVLRWSTPSPGSKQQAKQQFPITLPDASYEPAAMALLQGLYQVEPWSKLLDDLTPQQQVQAAVLADMWDLTAATEAALGVLQTVTVADNVYCLSAVLEQLLSMEAVPDCLMPLFDSCWKALLGMYSTLAAVPDSVLPVFENMLLSKYGNLEAVWGPAGAVLQKSLLRLPLYAMELLLASDRLQVRSHHCSRA